MYCVCRLPESGRMINHYFEWFHEKILPKFWSQKMQSGLVVLVRIFKLLTAGPA